MDSNEIWVAEIFFLNKTSLSQTHKQVNQVFLVSFHCQRHKLLRLTLNDPQRQGQIMNDLLVEPLFNNLV